MLTVPRAIALVGALCLAMLAIGHGKAGGAALRFVEAEGRGPG